MQSKSPPPKSIPELETAARDAAERGLFKEAIAAFKELLKKERRAEWQEALASAYLQRAAEVAGKGMYQEAALLWENHRQLLPHTPLSESYLAWLARAGQFGKLAQSLVTAPESVSKSTVGRQLTELLALMALDNEKLLGQLPKDHPIAKHQPLIKRAIGSYSANRDSEAEECLQGISSRSPYRNVRTLLKALPLFEGERAAALAMLDRLDGDSVCRGFAEALRCQGRNPLSDAEDYFGLPAKQQNVINRLNGYGKEQLGLLRDVYKAVKANSARTLLEPVLRHRGQLGESISRRFCRAALVDYPGGIPLFERAFGKLTPFEQHRVAALHAETKRINAEAAWHWEQCIEALEKNPPGQQEPRTRASILRHMAQLATHEVPDIAIGYLQRSLELEPDDKDCYLQIISLCEQLDDAKLAQSCLNQAVERYPRDPEVLALAMRAAGRRKAFKKAAGYAKTLLKIDPINRQARQFLLEAHLGHARKQLKACRPDRARPELQQAKALDLQRRNAALLFAEGLADFQELDDEGCAQLFREGWTAAGGGALAQFQLFMEILGVGFALPGPAQLIDGLDKKYVADSSDLMALVKAIGGYQQDKQDLSVALQKLGPMLKRSFKQADLSEQDFSELCRCLADAGQYELLAECAKQGLRKNPVAPIFIYYEVLAQCRGMASRLSRANDMRLQFAWEQARHQGNQRVSALIDNFIRQYEESLGFGLESFAPEIPSDIGMAVPQELTETMGAIEKLGRMSRQDIIAFLAEGQSPAPFEKLPQQTLMEMALDKTMLEQLGIGLNSLMELTSSGKGPKGRKR